MPGCSCGQAAKTIVPFTWRNVEGLMVPFRRYDKIAHLVTFSDEQIALERRFGPGVFELGEVAAEFYLQRRRTVRKSKSLQLRNDPTQDRQSLLSLLLRKRRRRPIIRPFD